MSIRLEEGYKKWRETTASVCEEEKGHSERTHEGGQLYY